MDSLNPNKQKQGLVFGRVNYLIMLLGIGLLALGFITMTLETAEYGFGNLGLNVGPALLFLGFMVEFAAIFYKSKESAS